MALSVGGEGVLLLRAEKSCGIAASALPGPGGDASVVGSDGERGSALVVAFGFKSVLPLGVLES